MGLACDLKNKMKPQRVTIRMKGSDSCGTVCCADEKFQKLGFIFSFENGHSLGEKVKTVRLISWGLKD